MDLNILKCFINFSVVLFPQFQSCLIIDSVEENRSKKDISWMSLSRGKISANQVIIFRTARTWDQKNVDIAVWRGWGLAFITSLVVTEMVQGSSFCMLTCFMMCHSCKWTEKRITTYFHTLKKLLELLVVNRTKMEVILPILCFVGL